MIRARRNILQWLLIIGMLTSASLVAAAPAKTKAKVSAPQAGKNSAPTASPTTPAPEPAQPSASTPDKNRVLAPEPASPPQAVAEDLSPPRIVDFKPSRDQTRCGG
jgi:hypothetical protein